MFNINPGHNRELLEACTRLRDYSSFIAEINRNLELGLQLDSAIRIAIDTCIANHILTDLLSKSRSEVFHMLLTEFDEKKFWKMTHQEGVEEGIEQGIERANQLFRILAEQNRTADIVRAATDKSYQRKLFREFHI